MTEPQDPKPLRQGEQGSIPRAVDRPMPAPIDIVLDPPLQHRSRTAAQRHRLRSLGRWLRTKTGRRVLIALVCAAALLFGLLWQGFLSSPAPDVTPPAAAQAATPDTPPPPPSPSPKKSSGAGTTEQGVLTTLRGRFPDNPLNHLGGASIHDVQIRVDSAAPVPIIGWLVPTGLSNAYGERRNGGAHFSLEQRALGGGYLAAIFIQAGKLGVPVTCEVVVDGKVTNRETTSGSYGRNVCLG